MATFAIQVAFQSDVEPWKSNQDIAVSYAWAVNRGSAWTGEGQRPRHRAEQMCVGDKMAFFFVDVAPNPVSEISRVRASFTKGPRAGTGQPESPFGNRSIGWPTQTLKDNFENVACNVKGRGIYLGSYEILHAGDYEVTVQFEAAGKKFGVDPEMEVIRN